MLAMVASSTSAGGFLTNTNQNVLFLRNPARDAAIAIDGVYSNPAGVSFMRKGWHLSLNIQSAYQTRTSTGLYEVGNFPSLAAETDVLRPFAMGEANRPDGTKEFEGKAQAPVVPSLQLAYVGERWTFSASMAVTGGGGKCKFDDGLGTFESQISMVPVLSSLLFPENKITGYSANSLVEGRQYYYGLQLGAGYRFNEHFSVFAGGRLVLADCNYYGYIRDIQMNIDGTMVPAGTAFRAQGYPNFATLVENRALDCDQSGWGFTPVIGLDYKIGKWNFAAKYEFKTRMRLKNKSNNTSGLEEYDDGRILAADIPAILTLGAQYEILPTLRASVGYHYFFDKSATQYNHREKALAGGGNEILAGIEYDINDKITASIGAQNTSYGLGDDSEFISDMSFVTNSTSVGLGVGIHLTEKMNLNVAYFKTFYRSYTKNMDDYNNLKTNLTTMMQKVAGGVLSEKEKVALQNISGVMSQIEFKGKDVFDRTNDVFGIGLDISF